MFVRAQTSDEGNLELGARLFKENCAVCHGQRGEGRVGANLAKSWPSVQPELTVRTIVENGIPGSVMPAWSQKKGGPLADTEIDALVLYVLSLGTGQIPTYPAPIQVTQRSPITPVPDVAGDPNNGAVLFDENCAVCHGKSGKGDRPYAGMVADIQGGSDITQLSKKNGGVFPVYKVTQTIDGRNMVKAHGPRDMPIWGIDYLIDARNKTATAEPPFDAEAMVNYKIYALAEYVYRLQAK